MLRDVACIERFLGSKVLGVTPGQKVRITSFEAGLPLRDLRASRGLGRPRRLDIPVDDVDCLKS